MNVCRFINDPLGGWGGVEALCMAMISLKSEGLTARKIVAKFNFMTSLFL